MLVYFYVHFIDINIINRTLHGRLEIRIIFSRVDYISNISQILAALENRICICARPSNILYISYTCHFRVTVLFPIQFTVTKRLQNDEYAVILEEGEEAHWEVRKKFLAWFFCWAAEQWKQRLFTYFIPIFS